MWALQAMGTVKRVDVPLQGTGGRVGDAIGCFTHAALTLLSPNNRSADLYIGS